MRLTGIRYTLQVTDDPGKPENLLACEVSRFQSSVDVSDKGSHETDMGEACGNGKLVANFDPSKLW